ncbi:MAG: hypothetical protein SNH71_05645 [Rikenellaceae bacterium]
MDSLEYSVVIKDKRIKKTNSCFFIYGNKNHKEIIPLPDNFDLEEHKEIYPPYEYGFPVDVRFQDNKIYCFLFLISSIPARNSDLIDDSNYTPIVIGKVANNIKDIKLYVDYLERTGVIDIDRQYIVRQKARGYKWANTYSSRPFISKQVVTKFADDIYKSQISTNSSEYYNTTPN